RLALELRAELDALRLAAFMTAGDPDPHVLATPGLEVGGDGESRLRDLEARKARPGWASRCPNRHARRSRPIDPMPAGVERRTLGAGGLQGDRELAGLAVPDDARVREVGRPERRLGLHGARRTIVDLPRDRRDQPVRDGLVELEPQPRGGLADDEA